MTTEIDAEGLLPCPFCGSTDLDDQGPSYTQIMCNQCGASEYDQASRTEAIAAWNRRATTRTSEAEPVAWRYRGPDPKSKWTVQKNRPTAMERWDGYTIEPLYTLPTPASDDQVEAVRAVLADLEWVHRQGGLGYRIHDKLEKCISALAAMGSTKP